MTDTTTNPTWLLIDGNNYVHRDYHAAADQADAVFARRIEVMRTRFKPSQLVVAFDAPQSFRTKIYPQYKASRPERPADLDALFFRVRANLIADGVDVVSVSDFEADDCLATLCHLARDAGQRVILASGDKDLRQLLQSGAVTQLLSVRRSGERLQCDWLTEDMLRDSWGITPRQWPDYQAMVGDKVDNIDGAEGIGKVAALKILKTCGSVHGYFADPWRANLTKRQMELMRRFRDRYATMLRLVTLSTAVPVPGAWHDLAEVTP